MDAHRLRIKTSCFFVKSRNGGCPRPRMTFSIESLTPMTIRMIPILLLGPTVVACLDLGYRIFQRLRIRLDG
jgi:hypothetical protein